MECQLKDKALPDDQIVRQPDDVSNARMFFLGWDGLYESSRGQSWVNHSTFNTCAMAFPFEPLDRVRSGRERLSE